MERRQNDRYRANVSTRQIRKQYLNAINNAAQLASNLIPAGYKTPAAIGTPIMLYTTALMSACYVAKGNIPKKVELYPAKDYAREIEKCENSD